MCVHRVPSYLFVDLICLICIKSRELFCKNKLFYFAHSENSFLVEIIISNLSLGSFDYDFTGQVHVVNDFHFNLTSLFLNNFYFIWVLSTQFQFYFDLSGLLCFHCFKHVFVFFWVSFTHFFVSRPSQRLDTNSRILSLFRYNSLRFNSMRFRSQFPYFPFSRVARESNTEAH